MDRSFTVLLVGIILINASACLVKDSQFFSNAPITTYRKPTFELKACNSQDKLSDSDTPKSDALLKEILRKLVDSNRDILSPDINIDNICIYVSSVLPNTKSKLSIESDFNAYALTHENEIVFGKDMILKSNNIDAIAAIVAHELAHISLRHAGFVALADKNVETMFNERVRVINNYENEISELNLKKAHAWHNFELEHVKILDEVFRRPKSRPYLTLAKIHKNYFDYYEALNTKSNNIITPAFHNKSCRHHIRALKPSRFKSSSIAVPKASAITANSINKYHILSMFEFHDYPAWSTDENVLKEYSNRSDFHSYLVDLYFRDLELEFGSAALKNMNDKLKVNLDFSSKEIEKINKRNELAVKTEAIIKHYIGSHDFDNGIEKETDDVGYLLYRRAGFSISDVNNFFHHLLRLENDLEPCYQKLQERQIPERGNESHPGTCWRVWNNNNNLIRFKDYLDGLVDKSSHTIDSNLLKSAKDELIALPPPALNFPDFNNSNLQSFK